MLKIDYSQMYLLSILFNTGNFMDKLTVKPEMLDYPFNNILAAFIKSYEMYGNINLDNVMMHLTNEELNELVSVADKAPAFDFKTFSSAQRIIHERVIQKELEKNVGEYRKGNITLLELKKRITIPSSNNYEKLSVNDLENSIKVDQKNINWVKFPSIRAILNLHETDLFIIAGTPGSGKSAMALNILNDFSRNYECVYINLEMSIQSLHKRLVSINSGIELNELSRFKYLDASKQKEVLESLNFIKQRDITLINKSQTLDDIKQLIDSKNRKHFILFIDHIGLVKSKEKDPYRKTTQIIEDLRSLSLDGNCTIIALSQLNRQASKDKPSMSMLRDSGAAEQSATQIMLLYSEQHGKETKYYANIVKNREGLTGKVQIYYNKRTQYITD